MLQAERNATERLDRLTGHIEALNEAIHKFGAPEIMNTDQGSQLVAAAEI